VLTPDFFTGSFRLHNVNAVGKCIGIDGSGLAGDWTCTTNADQTWHWGTDPILPNTNWDQLINGQSVNGQPVCLGVQGGSDAMGARIVAWPCLGTGHPDQYWNLGQSNFGGFNILNYQALFDPNTPASLIGVAGGSTANGAPIILWSNDGTQNQFWS